MSRKSICENFKKLIWGVAILVINSKSRIMYHDHAYTRDVLEIYKIRVGVDTL